MQASFMRILNSDDDSCSVLAGGLLFVPLASSWVCLDPPPAVVSFDAVVLPGAVVVPEVESLPPPQPAAAMAKSAMAPRIRTNLNRMPLPPAHPLITLINRRTYLH